MQLDFVVVVLLLALAFVTLSGCQNDRQAPQSVLTQAQPALLCLQPRLVTRRGITRVETELSLCEVAVMQ